MSPKDNANVCNFRSLFWRNTGPSEAIVSSKGSVEVCRRLSKRFSKTHKFFTFPLNLIDWLVLKSSVEKIIFI